jgi:hypothetical protein
MPYLESGPKSGCCAGGARLKNFFGLSTDIVVFIWKHRERMWLTGVGCDSAANFDP